MRKSLSLGLTGAVTAGILVAGVGAAFADTVDYTTASFGGVESVWDETTHVLSACDTAQDGLTAYVYYESAAGAWTNVHSTLGAGTCNSVTVSSYYDWGNAIHIRLATVDNAGIVNETGTITLNW